MTLYHIERLQFEDSLTSSSVGLTDDSVGSDVSDVAALLQSKPQPRVPLPQVDHVSVHLTVSYDLLY